jgi:hypothetical protein
MPERPGTGGAPELSGAARRMTWSGYPLFPFFLRMRLMGKTTDGNARRPGMIVLCVEKEWGFSGFPWEL